MSLEQTPSKDQAFVGSGSIEELLGLLNQQLLERPGISPNEAIQSVFVVLRTRIKPSMDSAETTSVTENEPPRLSLRNRLVGFLHTQLGI